MAHSAEMTRQYAEEEWASQGYPAGGSRFGGFLCFTVFLPITLLVALPIRSRPGSPYTLGMVAIGFLAVLAIPGFVLALIAQEPSLAALCAYWWSGAKVVESELRDRGYYV